MAYPDRAIYTAWSEWRKGGGYPYPGGWGQQPLFMLIQIKVIEMTYNTVSYMQQKDMQLSKLTPLQQELAKWLEKSKK